VKVTNHTSLPEPVYLAAIGDYDAGDSDLTITQLIDSPRVVALTRKYNLQLEEDVSDMGARLIGNALHAAFEKYKESEVSEQRYYLNILGWTISGKPDGYLNGTLYDYKTMSVSEWERGIKDEREKQLNCYAELLRQNGVEVNALNLVVVFKDYKRGRVRFHSWYPEHEIMQIPVEMWDRQRAYDYLHERVALHQAALREVPLCTDEERWYNGGKWAVMKGGNKRATKLHESMEEAYAHAEELGEEYHVEAREGYYNRCEAFCVLAKNRLCQQWLDETEGA